MMRGFTLIALIFPKVLGLETQATGGEKRCRSEERACSTVKNTEREPGLERYDAGDRPALGQSAERESTMALRLWKFPGVADHEPVRAIESRQTSLGCWIVLIIEYLLAKNRNAV